MGIINATGQDGVGKSTIVKGLSELTGWENIHFDKPRDMKDGKQQYFSFADKMNNDISKNIICDRLHEGEWVYAPLYRGYKADYMREFEREIIQKHNFLLVYVKASLNTIIERTRIRGEDFVKEEDFQTVRNLFEDYMNAQALPYIEVDTTNSETSNDLKKILEAYSKVDKIWTAIREGNAPGAIITPAFPRGNVEADIMVIGQNPGGRGKPNVKYSTTWCDINLSEFMMNITKEADIHRNSWYTNLVPYPTSDNKVTNEQVESTLDILKLQVELIQPKKIATLGNISKDVVTREFGKDFEIVPFQHPAYVKRFMSGKPDKLKEYINKFSNLKE